MRASFREDLPGRRSVLEDLMKFWVVMTVLSAAVFGTATARASTEVVLILDNSPSMIRKTTFTTRYPDGRQDVAMLPAADPDRLAVLATLILNGIMSGDDKLTILSFQKDAPHFLKIPNQASAIRAYNNNAPTLFAGAFQEAARILRSSRRERRLLLICSDGPPEDLTSPAQGRRRLGLDQPSSAFDVLAFNLSTEPASTRQDYLHELVAGAGRHERVGDPYQLVAGFTSAYARTLGSKPLSGRLGNGDAFDFVADRYVSEVIVVAASLSRTPAFEATLFTDGRPVPERSSGDNGCSARILGAELAPNLCKAPFHTFKVWRADKDPKKVTSWSLKLASGSPSDIAYGVILRYELSAEVVQAPDSARAGEPIPVVGRIRWHDQTFDDRSFYSSPKFQATMFIGNLEGPLAQGGDLLFRGAVEVGQPGLYRLGVVFENEWVALRSRIRTIEVKQWASLRIIAALPDFGRWAGRWRTTESCRSLDLTGSHNADVVPIEVLAKGIPEGTAVTVDGTAVPRMRPLPLAGKKLQYEVCVVAERCCAELDGKSSQLVIRGRNPYYHASAASVPLHFAVEATTLLGCWWLVILGVLGLILLAIAVHGKLSPYSFDVGDTVRISRHENKLQRGASYRLAEQPGGRRGFYRNATVGFDNSASPVGPRRTAIVRFTAAEGGIISLSSGVSVEMRDRRTRKWEALKPEDAQCGVRKNVVYRVGEYYFRLN